MTAKELIALSQDIMRFTNEPFSDDLPQEQIDEFEKLRMAAKRSSVIRRFNTLVNHKLGDSFK
jgi:hypothetical protein